MKTKEFKPGDSVVYYNDAKIVGRVIDTYHVAGYVEKQVTIESKGKQYHVSSNHCKLYHQGYSFDTVMIDENTFKPKTPEFIMCLPPTYSMEIYHGAEDNKFTICVKDIEKNYAYMVMEEEMINEQSLSNTVKECIHIIKTNQINKNTSLERRIIK